jgi:hypothetical protein
VFRLAAPTFPYHISFKALPFPLPNLRGAVEPESWQMPHTLPLLLKFHVHSISHQLRQSLTHLLLKPSTLSTRLGNADPFRTPLFDRCRRNYWRWGVRARRRRSPGEGGPCPDPVLPFGRHCGSASRPVLCRAGQPVPLRRLSLPLCLHLRRGNVSNRKEVAFGEVLLGEM